MRSIYIFIMLLLRYIEAAIYIFVILFLQNIEIAVYIFVALFLLRYFYCAIFALRRGRCLYFYYPLRGWNCTFQRLNMALGKLRVNHPQYIGIANLNFRGFPTLNSGRDCRPKLPALWLPILPRNSRRSRWHFCLQFTQNYAKTLKYTIPTAQKILLL